MLGRLVKKFVLPAMLVIALEANCFAQHELPLPSVPQQMRNPQQRAAYIISHFWDAMDFSDTLKSRNRTFMEQNMVNWLSLFPHAAEDSIRGSVANFFKSSMADIKALRLVLDIGEQYLYDAYSPMRCEEHYILFLEEFLALPVIYTIDAESAASHALGVPELERVRAKHQLEIANRNRVGRKAADFSYILRSGESLNKKERVKRLYKTRAKSMLLMFYAPNCRYCKDVIAGIVSSGVLQDLVKSGELLLLAVYADGNRELWNATAPSMPEEWIVGYDTGKIVEQELYWLPFMPVVYLLDRNKNVLLKEATVSQIEEYFAD